MIGSALGLDPDDMSEAAKAKRQLRGLADLNGITFVAKVSVEPSNDARYPDHNRLDQPTPPVLLAAIRSKVRGCLERHLPERPSTEQEPFAMRRAAWRKQGIVAIRPAEVRDDWARQALINEATRLYGQWEFA